MVADLSAMQAVDVDAAARTATAGGGTRWGRFNDLTAAHGLATTGGIVSTTGIAGVTLGAGGTARRGDDRPDAVAGAEQPFRSLPPSGLQHYWKAAFVVDLPDEAIAAHMEHGARMPTITAGMFMYMLGGAVHDVPSDATAFGHRDARYVANVAGVWENPADNERNIQWVRDYFAAIAPYSKAGGYTSFASGDEQDRAAENYGANYSRPAEVKRRYDPDNVFHLNQNIRPSVMPTPQQSPP